MVVIRLLGRMLSFFWLLLIFLLFSVLWSAPVLAESQPRGYAGRVERPAAPAFWARLRDDARGRWLEFDAARFRAVAREIRESGEALVQLPMPAGDPVQVLLRDSEVLPPGLQAKFPRILTLAGEVPSQPQVRVRLEWNGHELGGALWRNGKRYWVQRVVGDPARQAYLLATPAQRLAARLGAEARDGPDKSAEDWSDTVLELPDAYGKPEESIGVEPISDATGGLRTIRVALATTGEYAQYHGGTKQRVMEELARAVNRVNEVFLRDLGVRLVLAEGTDQLIFLDPYQDPFSNGDLFKLLQEGTGLIPEVMPDDSYDLGHVFGVGGGGLAYKGVVCRPFKSGGVTGVSQPTGDYFWIDYVAHEIGHQLGADHTFNGEHGNCSVARNENHAFEPGSGSTIMGYAGICSLDNIQARSDDYLHVGSIEQVRELFEFLDQNSPGCGAPGSAGRPQELFAVLPPGGFVLPKETPFFLAGDAYAPAGAGDLLYSWEQIDLGPSAGLGEALPGTEVPLFRSLRPSANPTRYLPQIRDLIMGRDRPDEQLPNYARRLSFALSVRDSEGALDFDTLEFEVTDQAGPFEVISPSQDGQFIGGEALFVSWIVADTDQPPVNCATVDILLAEDAGEVFDTVLSAGTPNDGFSVASLPNRSIAQGILMVRCSSAPFFALAPGQINVFADGGAVGADYDIVIPDGKVIPTASLAAYETTRTVRNGGSLRVDSGGSLRLRGSQVRLLPGFIAKAGSKVTIQPN